MIFHPPRGALERELGLNGGPVKKPGQSAFSLNPWDTRFPHFFHSATRKKVKKEERGRGGVDDGHFSSSNLKDGRAATVPLPPPPPPPFLRTLCIYRRDRRDIQKLFNLSIVF